MSLVLTCEHAGARVPVAWTGLFEGVEAVLASHRGWDPGAWPLARFLARALGAPLLGHHVTRLLVEANRSPGHPAFFSEFTRDLPDAAKRRIVGRYWEPHRRRVSGALRRALDEGGSPLVHVAVHTFTPVLEREVRDADVGLLYDPGRSAEATFCLRWQALLRRRDRGLRVRRNYPYRGATDGLTTALRRELAGRPYLGIELEVNQAALAARRRRRRVHAVLADTLEEALARVEAADGDVGRPAGRTVA